MAEAKFAVGQVVTFNRGFGDANIPAGEFTILRVMPSEGNRRVYRVRGARDGQERAFPEDQLTAAGSGWPTSKR
jgi:hypothetical protein